MVKSCVLVISVFHLYSSLLNLIPFELGHSVPRCFLVQICIICSSCSGEW